MATKKTNKPKQVGKAQRAAEPKATRAKVVKRETGDERKARPKPQRRAGKEGETMLELQLRKTVAELGLTKARQIFESVEQAFGE
jgi:hypothetical protein